MLAIDYREALLRRTFTAMLVLAVYLVAGLVKVLFTIDESTMVDLLGNCANKFGYEGYAKEDYVEGNDLVNG